MNKFKLFFCVINLVTCLTHGMATDDSMATDDTFADLPDLESLNSTTHKLSDVVSLQPGPTLPVQDFSMQAQQIVPPNPQINQGPAQRQLIPFMNALALPRAPKRKSSSTEASQDEMPQIATQKKEKKPRIHTNYTHPCPTCGLMCHSPAAVETHMHTHTGKKPLKCRQCNKGFAARGGLNRHMRTHTGEKPFPCTHCQMRFADSGNLKKHESKNHKGE